MGQFFTALTMADGAWLVAGPETDCTVVLVGQQVVTYSQGYGPTGLPLTPVGSVPAPDTLLALTRAVSLGGGAIDRTLDEWMIYTIPGSGVISACRITEIGTISADYGPLARLTLHDMLDWYEGVGGGSGTLVIT